MKLFRFAVWTSVGLTFVYFAGRGLEGALAYKDELYEGEFISIAVLLACMLLAGCSLLGIVLWDAATYLAYILFTFSAWFWTDLQEAWSRINAISLRGRRQPRAYRLRF
ncbi:hypothetical protein KW797_02770 [Candidatus Parcubacteria bacterium]|nr:hypothetical protein [Candidatus Parcubacteria bacterium]